MENPKIHILGKKLHFMGEKIYTPNKASKGRKIRAPRNTNLKTLKGKD